MLKVLGFCLLVWFPGHMGVALAQGHAFEQSTSLPPSVVVAQTLSNKALVNQQIEGSSQSYDDASPQAWIARMSRALRERNYDIAFVYLRDEKLESMRLIHAFHEGSQKERLMHLDGPEREIIRDDELVTGYFPNSAPVILDNPSAHRPLASKFIEDLAAVQSNYRLSFNGQGRVAGRDTLRLQVLSEDDHRYNYELWLDRASALLLRTDVRTPSGKLVEQMRAIQLQLLESVPESLLAVSFDLEGIPSARPPIQMRPANDRPSDQSLDWHVSWLPKGFELKASNLQSASAPAHQKDVVSLLFSDGLASVSVFIKTRQQSGENPPRVLHKGGITVYDLNRQTHNVTVVGDVPAATAARIARSVERLATEGRADFSEAAEERTVTYDN